MSGATFLPIAVHAFYGTLRMLWVKAFHIVFIASWFAGLFYLPRIFVNLAMETERAAITRLLIMARKLFRFTTIRQLSRSCWGCGCSWVIALDCIRPTAGCTQSSRWCS